MHLSSLHVTTSCALLRENPHHVLVKTRIFLILRDKNFVT